MSSLNNKQLLKAAAVAKLKALQLNECFDPNYPDSRPNAAQLEFFKDTGKVKYRYIRAGNGSGKSAVGGREISWIVQDIHPYWKMPEDWKTRPLQILVVGKSRNILETELWNKKIKPFFAKDEWKETRTGGALQYVTHRQLDHKIIFLTHSDGSQRAIDNLQAYDADVVWLDEMPRSYSVLEETQRRTRRPNTMWFATFTPKSINVKVRKFVDAAKLPISKRYSMSILDVPGVDRESKLAEISFLSRAEQQTILHGEWASADENVYTFDVDTMCVDKLPAHYSVTWRHVESVDPGSNRGGLQVWAEDPINGVWYCVRAEYIDGLRDPVAFYEYCQKATAGYNIVRRICDPAATAHIGYAAAQKCTPMYTSPYAKNQGRKEELIKNFQKLLSNGTLKLVETECSEYIDELSNAQRADNGRIINSHAYHLADCGHYFADMIPKGTPTQHKMTRDAQMLAEDDKRREAEAKAEERKNRKKSKAQIHKFLVKVSRGRRWN